MRMNDNTILITGGATGIGFSLAKYFHERNNTIIICGRRVDKLKEAKKELQGIYAVKCDVANTRELKELFKYAKDNFPNLNILINNAGIQRDIDLQRFDKTKVN